MNGHIPPEPECDEDRQMLSNVQEYGCHIVLVEHAPDTEPALPPFAYSIGLYSNFGHPEIVVHGLPNHDLVAYMINHTCDLAREGNGLVSGVRYDDFLVGFQVETSDVHPSHYRELFGYGLWYYKGQLFPVLQLVFPTTQGVWPWDEDASEDFLYVQPVLNWQQDDPRHPEYIRNPPF